jgi:membrane-bound ClpP family serine protease
MYPTLPERRSTPGPLHVLFRGWPALAAVWFGLCATSLSRADDKLDGGVIISEPSEPDGLVADLPKRIEGALKRYRDEGHRGTFKVIYDFNPGGKESASSNYPACLKLAEDLDAKALSDRHDVTVETVAFIHGEVRLHSVLPALACSRRIMSLDPPSKLGKVWDDPKQPLPRDREAKYHEIAARHKGKNYNGKSLQTFVQKLYDARQDELSFVVKDAAGNETPRKFARGELAEYTVEDAETIGLSERFPRDPGRESRHDPLDLDEVRERLLPHPSILYESSDKSVVRRLVINGVLNDAKREEVLAQFDAAVRQQKATFVILQLECGDGNDTQAAFLLAQDLVKRSHEARVETLAYVRPQARNTAAFLALACNRIVMHPDARLGGFEEYARKSNFVADNLAAVAQSQKHPAAAARALATEKQPLVWARNKQDPSVYALILGDSNPKAWERLREVKADGVLLTLTAEDAVKYRVADRVDDSFEKLCEQEGIKPGDVKDMERYIFQRFAEFLRDTWVTMALVMIGITCLILELKMPGVTLPGIIAALCFILLFWAHWELNGQVVWLAVLLFGLGLVLLLIEIFVMPGSVVCGVSGIVLVLGGLGLMVYGKWPQSGSEWAGLGGKVGPFGVVCLLSVVAALVLAHYLPYIPILNRLVHKPEPEADADADTPEAAAAAELAGLLGAIGIAVTPLRPAGKVQFGEQFIDVIAEGAYIQPGARVQVIEIEGNRVVVKDV